MRYNEMNRQQAQAQLWIDYFREWDTTKSGDKVGLDMLWIDYFREWDTTDRRLPRQAFELWIDYFREWDTTK